MKLLVTCNPGTEDVALDELRRNLSVVGYEVRSGRGRLVVEVNATPAELGRLSYVLGNLRSIHSATLLLAYGKARADKGFLDELRRSVDSAQLWTYITPSTKFAVRSERVGGPHEYTSIDVARAVGDAVVECVRRRYGAAPKVDLDAPSVVVKADVVHDEYYIGVLITGEESLHRRGYRVVDHPAALKPSLAYVMLVLGGAKDGESILDPMCGCGTIPIEAAMLLENAKCACMDINPAYISGAVLNSLAAGVYGRIRFMVGDARRLNEYFDQGSVDRIVTNPPYGIRLGDPSNVRDLYRRFLESALDVLKDTGTLTLITAEYRYVEEYAPRYGYRIVHERMVAHGSLWSKIIVLGKSA